MSNLILQDILQTVRYLSNEPSPQGRFPDAELINYVNMATIQVMLGAEWPEATYSWTSDGIQAGPGTELLLPEMYSVNRVYCAGQLCVPTSIPILEGDAIGVFDQQGATRTPAWKQATFTGYPVASFMGGPSNAGLPYFQGQRPGYYFRGGALGIAPPPTKGYIVSLDVYPAPQPLVQFADQTFFPQLFKETIAYRTLGYAYFADNTDEGASRSATCMQQYERQLNTVIKPWKSKFERNLPNKPMPTPHRTYFQGPARGPTGRSSRFGG